MSPFLLLAALVPAVFLMVQVYRLDRIEKEPPGLLVRLVLFGALSGLIAGAVEGALTRLLTLGVSRDRKFLHRRARGGKLQALAGDEACVEEPRL